MNATQKLAEIIKDIRIAMITTVDADGSLRSRPMATQQTEFDGNLWFFTAANSGKVNELENDSHVNVSYASSDHSRYISISGTARLVKDHGKISEFWNPIYQAWFPKGLADPDLALLEVEVHKAEYWESPASKVVQLAGFVKAIATGQQYKGGEHQQLDLQDSR